MVSTMPSMDIALQKKRLDRPTIISRSAPRKKARMMDGTSPSFPVEEKTSVANALLQLKSGGRSPMAQWTKLFHNNNDESSDEGLSEEEEGVEDRVVQILVQAMFSKQQRRDSLALSRLAGVPPDPVKPDDFLKQLLASEGKTVKYTSASSLDGFFTKVSDSFVEGYTMDVVKAVRSNDVAALREMHANGHKVLCGSKFGDSIVHLACRRNCDAVLHFLLHEVGISPRLVCDFGRTPLHDALWVSKPNETIVKMLLQACPDLLYITDKRGSTPLAYLPKAQWQSMCQFLEHQDLNSLIAREIDQ